MIKLMGVNSVFVFLLLGFPILKAQDFVILDELEPNTWDTEKDNPIAEGESHLEINNQKLDHSILELNSRDDFLGERYHVLRKREVGDNELEDGSGVGEPPRPEVSNKNATTTAVSPPQTALEVGGSSMNSSDNSQAIEFSVKKAADQKPENISSNVEKHKEEVSLQNQNSSTTAPASTPKKDPEAKLTVDHSDSDKAEDKDDQLAPSPVQKSEDEISEITSNNLDDINDDKQVVASAQNTTAEENKANEKLAEASVPSNVDKNVEADLKPGSNETNTKESEKEKEPLLPSNNQTLVNNEHVGTSIGTGSTNSVKPLAAVEQKVDEAPVDTNNLTVSLREPKGGNMDLGIEDSNNDLQKEGNKEDESDLENEQNGNENKGTLQDPKIPEISSKDSSALEKVFEAATNETEKLKKHQKVNNEEVSIPSSTSQDIPRHQSTIAPPALASKASASNGTERMDKNETTTAPPIQNSVTTSSTWQDVHVKGTTGVIIVGTNDSETATKKVPPSDLAGVDPTTKSKTVEKINDQQSGNAVMFKEPKFGAKTSIEASDSEKHLASLATNAKISNATSDSDEPNTGESARTVSKAGKDTTILVVLFVVVIVVGAAAFTHNFIKKRKQNAAQNSDIVNGIRRSLQNLTSGNEKDSTDIEQGTEMKPLIKENSPVIVKEYSDTKKEAEA